MSLFSFHDKHLPVLNKIVPLKKAEPLLYILQMISKHVTKRLLGTQFPSRTMTVCTCIFHEANKIMQIYAK